MQLNSDQKDTLLRIWVNSEETLDPCDYSPKELAPSVSAKNVSIFFRRLEEAGLVSRLFSEGGRAFAICLTDEGADAAIARKQELTSLLAPVWGNLIR